MVLPCDTKLVVTTWKEVNFWYLTRPMRPDAAPETYVFVESSNFGVLEGKMVIREARCKASTRADHADHDELGLAILRH